MTYSAQTMRIKNRQETVSPTYTTGQDQFELSLASVQKRSSATASNKLTWAGNKFFGGDVRNKFQMHCLHSKRNKDTNIGLDNHRLSHMSTLDQNRISIVYTNFDKIDQS